MLAKAVYPAVLKARGLHAGLASQYYSEARDAVIGGDGAALPDVRPYVAEALAEGIKATTRDRLLGGTFDRVVTATAARHARAAGTDLIRDAVTVDEQATGWARVHTGSKAPCSFCAMLISRGPVYKSQDTAGFAAHNGCECHPEPLFTRRAEWVGAEQYEHYRSLWNDVTEGDSGRDALNAFRRKLST